MNVDRSRILAALAAASVLGCDAGLPAADAVGNTPAFGHPDSVLFWTPTQQLAGFPNYDRLFDTRLVPAAADGVRELPIRAGALPDLAYTVDSVRYGLEDFLAHNHVAGLIVVQRDSVVLERYTGSNDPSTRWVSYSVAKSVVSLLFGAAIEDGYIGGVDDLVTDYVPLLRGSSYEGVRIRDVLQMSSGVEWNEDYTDPDADVSREIGLSNIDRLRFLSSKPRAASPGSRFNYNTGETHLAGAVLRSAVGNNLASYLHQQIWEPFGMESDANWVLVERGGAEHGGCCISATLRDYARIGLFVLDDGTLPDGRRVLPEGWIAESVAPSPARSGYGYLWWLDGDGSFSARGIFGQLIHIDPAADLVIAMHGAWPEPTSADRSAHRAAFLAAVKAALN